jgi:hypothetical protein
MRKGSKADSDMEPGRESDRTETVWFQVAREQSIWPGYGQALEALSAGSIERKSPGRIKPVFGQKDDNGKGGGKDDGGKDDDAPITTVNHAPNMQRQHHGQA